MTNRIKIEEKSNELKIIILSKMIWPVIVITIPILIFFVFTEIKAVTHLLNSGYLNIFLIFWAIANAIGLLLYSKQMLWILFGEEIISINHPIILVKRSIFNLGLKRIYYIDRIENLRVRDESIDKPKKSRIKTAGVRNPDAGMLKFEYNRVC